MKVLCTICFKKKSYGLKNKNFKKIDNKIPLYQYTYNIAKKVKFFTNIVIFSDAKIKLKENKKNTLILNRPKNLCQKYTSKLDIIISALKKTEIKKKIKYDVIVDLDVTSPRRSLIDIRKAFSIFLKSQAENLFSVNHSKKNPYFNMIEKHNRKYKLVKPLNKSIQARQKAPEVYDMNASIYIWKRSALLQKKIFTNKTEVYIMPFLRSIDIDSIDDFIINKYLIKHNV